MFKRQRTQQMEQKFRFMEVKCLICLYSTRCRSCSSWQSFLYAPTVSGYLELKNYYFSNYETDMCILSKQFYILHEDRAPAILIKLGLKELFDNYGDWNEATTPIHTSTLH